jgi:succinoglycan biosynthesis protein ExoA
MMTQELASQRSPSRPVLVVIPCLNEGEHIEGIVSKLLAEADEVDLQIVLADGGSTDGTRTIIERLARSDKRVAFLDNPKRIQAAAVNGAVRHYGDQADFLIRVDGHADYPSEYCRRLIDAQARTQADSVVVSMHSQGHSCFQRAAAAAQNSILGNGGAAHRNRAEDRWVEHGHHALMRIEAFKAVGGYDDSFSHNEDAELDVRLIAEGFHIFLTSEVSVTYYPRHSFIALFRQYFHIGHGRARNFLKHRWIPKLRQLILIGIAPAVSLAVLTPLSGIFALPALLWSVACIGYGASIGIRAGDPCAAAAGIAAMATQAGWSFGFFRGIVAAGWQRVRRACGAEGEGEPAANGRAHKRDITR